MILLDHCVPRRYLRLIQGWGYDAELLITHLTADSSDAQVIALAVALDAVLFTVDLDFTNILEYPPADYQGIVVLRYQSDEEASLDATLQSVLTDLYRDGLRGVLVIVSPGRYRIRS